MTYNGTNAKGQRITIETAEGVATVLTTETVRFLEVAEDRPVETAAEVFVSLNHHRNVDSLMRELCHIGASLSYGDEK